MSNDIRSYQLVSVSDGSRSAEILAEPAQLKHYLAKHYDTPELQESYMVLDTSIVKDSSDHMVMNRYPLVTVATFIKAINQGE